MKEVSFSTAASDRWFEDYEVGGTYQLGSFSLSEAEIVEFAQRFDPQPFHIDPDAARASPYGGIIASGPLKGIAFGPNGTPYNYNFGDFTSGFGTGTKSWHTILTFQTGFGIGATPWRSAAADTPSEREGRRAARTAGAVSSCMTLSHIILTRSIRVPRK